MRCNFSNSVFQGGCLVFLLAFLAGCGNSGPGLNPVSGQVFHKGDPAIGALVHFHPVDTAKGTPAFATVDFDGNFQLTTKSENDGAFAGDYIVTINWRIEEEVDGEIVIGPNELNESYGKPGTSDLRVTVIEGDNHIPRFDVE